jgi:hypothetical protein
MLKNKSIIKPKLAKSLLRKSLLRRILAYYVSLFKRKPRIRRELVNIIIDNIGDIEQLMSYHGDHKNHIYRLWVPSEKVCMHGAFRCVGGWHPFVAFLHHGVDALALFYQRFKPANIAQMYFQKEKGLVGEDLPQWELPWIPRNVMNPPRGEEGLSIEHGVSYFGPVSEDKLRVECRRLSAVKESIENTGYLPGSDINGFFLEYENDFVFFVRGGKHRAAVLSFLGYKRIPVVFRDGWPDLIRSNTSAQWPLVKSGKICEDLAVSIFKSYFLTNGKHQLSKLDIGYGY